jgi:hypothetical protein
LLVALLLLIGLPVIGEDAIPRVNTSAAWKDVLLPVLVVFALLALPSISRFKAGPGGVDLEPVAQSDAPQLATLAAGTRPSYAVEEFAPSPFVRGRSSPAESAADLPVDDISL